MNWRSSSLLLIVNPVFQHSAYPPMRACLCFWDQREREELSYFLPHRHPITSLQKMKENSDPKKVLGSTEIWTRIAGFRVLSANHYTMEPNWRKVSFHKNYTKHIQKVNSRL